MTVVSELQNRGNALIENLGRVLQRMEEDPSLYE